LHPFFDLFISSSSSSYFTIKMLDPFSKLTLFFFIGICILFTSCEKEESFDPPVITEGTKRNVYATFPASWEIALLAEGGIQEVTTTPEGTFAHISDLTGVGETSGTATINFLVSSPGFYSVKVSILDLVGQTSYVIISVTVKEKPNSITVKEAKVLPVNDETGLGSISLELAGGAPPYSYEWRNGETSESIDELDPGIYAVKITDDAGQVLFEAFEIEDLTGQVVMIDGDGNLYETVLLSGYHWTDRNVMSFKRGDGSNFPIVTSDTSWMVNEGDEVVFYSEDWLLPYKDMSITMMQYTEPAAQRLCPEGWSLPPRSIANWRLNPDLWEECGACWTGRQTSEEAREIFSVLDPLSYHGYKRGSQNILAEPGPIWANIGGANYIWSRGPAMDNPEIFGEVMVWFAGDLIEYWGQEKTGTANCRCVKLAE